MVYEPAYGHRRHCHYHRIRYLLQTWLADYHFCIDLTAEDYPILYLVGLRIYYLRQWSRRCGMPWLYNIHFDLKIDLSNDADRESK
jgi:hypothetical protein